MYAVESLVGKWAASIKQRAGRGIAVNVTHETVLRMLPPYIITEREVDRAIRGLRNVFRKAGKNHAKPGV